MFTALRHQLQKPKVRFALAGGAMSWGAITLRDLAKDTRRDLDELVELHAETRTRVFALETIEEGRRAVNTEPQPGERLPRVTAEIFDDREANATEEVQQ